MLIRILRGLFAHHHAERVAEFAALRIVLANITQRIIRMSDTQDTVVTEVAALKANVASLHTGVADIQARLTAALAGDVNDPTVVADLHAINADLAGVVAGLAPPATPTV